MNKNTLEKRIAYLEKKLCIKNESTQRDIIEFIYMDLDEGILSESAVIDECLSIMTEHQLKNLCHNLDIPY